MAEIDEQLREAIRRDPRTESAISAAAGVNRSITNRLVRGERSITLESAERLARALGLELRLGRPRRLTKARR